MESAIATIQIRQQQRHTSLTMISSKPDQAVTRIMVHTINAGTTIAALVASALVNIC